MSCTFICDVVADVCLRCSQLPPTSIRQFGGPIPTQASRFESLSQLRAKSGEIDQKGACQAPVIKGVSVAPKLSKTQRELKRLYGTNDQARATHAAFRQVRR